MVGLITLLLLAALIFLLHTIIVPINSGRAVFDDPSEDEIAFDKQCQAYFESRMRLQKYERQELAREIVREMNRTR